MKFTWTKKPLRSPMDLRTDKSQAPYILAFDVMTYDGELKFRKGDILSYDHLKQIYKPDYLSDVIMNPPLCNPEPLSEQAIILKSIDSHQSANWIADTNGGYINDTPENRQRVFNHQKDFSRKLFFDNQ
jgi:hypothetical protein